MSVEHITWAKRQICGSPTVKAVLVHLANSADADHDECFPSVRAIAEATEFSGRAVQGALRKLEEFGLINTLSQTRDDGGNKSNRYYVNLGVVSPLGERPPRSRRWAADAGSHRHEARPTLRRTCEAPSARNAPPYRDDHNETTIVDDHNETNESSAVRAREAPSLFGEEALKIVTGEIVTFRNDVEQAMDAFNETADKFVKWRSCKLLVQKRTEAIRKTLKEIGGLARWREALAMAEESEFLTSAPPRQGEHKNWRVSIDWFAKPQTIAGILEGKYSQGNGRNLTLGGTTESMLEGLARGYQREMEG